MRKRIIGLAIVLGLVAGGRAEASFLTFNELPDLIILDTLDYQGFRFSSEHFHTFGDSPLNTGIANNGTTHLGYESGRGHPMTMTRVDGGSFSLNSLDISEFYSLHVADRPNAQLLTISGYNSSNTLLSHTIYLDNLVADWRGGVVDFEHHELADIFRDMTSVTFTGLRFDGRDGGITLDSIEYDRTQPQPQPTSVPEPGTLALFGMGLLATGAAARRRYRIDQ